MRADAEANRERVLDAASEVFAERGIDAPLSLIAARAGVGKGTVYRHFVDRDALIVGLAERLQDSYEELAAAASSAPTGWDALVIYLDGATAMYLDFPWMVVVRARARRLVRTRGGAEAAFRLVLERAWAEGSLRTDIEFTDLVFVTTALGRLVDLPESIRAVAVPRLRDIIFDGLRAETSPREPLRGRPLDLENYREYMRQQADAAGD